MKTGILFVLSGPSGAGKGTIATRTVAEDIEIGLSISATTRAPRQGEVEGKHYFFKTFDEFEKIIAEGGFIEYVKKFGNYYGTPKAAVEKMLAEGNDVLLEIETTGALSVKKQFPEAVLIFTTPSDPARLGERLDMRSTETEEAKRLRLAVAASEYACMNEYDYLLLNDGIDKCLLDFKSIIIAERQKIKHNADIIARLNSAK